MTDSPNAARDAARTAVAVTLAILLAFGLMLGAVAAPASAGDGVTIFFFEPEDLEADAGETVTLELVVSDHGDYNDNGIDNLSAAIEYNSDVLTVADVEHGPMLADGDPDAEVDGTVEIDDEAGTLTIEQERTPSGDGAMATATAATLTLEIAPDAEPTTAPLEIAESSTTLITDYPQNTVERPAEIAIEGGDSATESDGASSDASESEDGSDGGETEEDDGPEGEEDDGSEDGNEDNPDGVTLADDPDDTERDADNGTNGSNEVTDDSSDEDATDSAEDLAFDDGDESDDGADSGNGGGDGDDAANTSSSADDSIPGFAVPGAIVALASWFGLRMSQRR